MKCPLLLPTLVIADDARLAAQVSCVLAQPGGYLPVVDGPRTARNDPQAEVARRNNATARAKSQRIVAAGLSDESFCALANGFRPRLIPRMQRISAASELEPTRPLADPPLVWGCDRIGVGLLKALREHRSIVFTDDPSPDDHVPPKGDHLVVCEDGDDLAQVMAANYAYAMQAGLVIIPAVADGDSEQILESFYNSDAKSEIPQSQLLADLRSRLRGMCGPIPVPPGGSMTFFTGRLPYGFAFPEVPSTHLFNYPDLGIAIINGFSKEQPDTPGLGVAVLVDPHKVDAPEVEAIQRILVARGMLVRCQKGGGARVREITEMVEWYPYDLLFIATHCQDVSGHRWTYEFTDSEGRLRTLVVDIAPSIARTDDVDMLRVTQFLRFVSLDGVDWHDPDRDQKLRVGPAINDFIARTRGPAGSEMQPIKKDVVARVVGSAVLSMNDHNYIPLPRPIADEGAPIIINNACCSWHRLAATFTFCNARAYVGTLISIGTSEAHDVIVRVLDRHFGKPLAHALWSAQREVYGEDPRRPYVVTGIYPQKIRLRPHDVPKELLSHLKLTLRQWQTTLNAVDPADTEKVKMVAATVKFYETEVDQFGKRRIPLP